jgi:CheY-like chemotaxis protein
MIIFSSFFSAFQFETTQEGHMSIKILLADDSITIQKVVGIIFGGEDYTLSVVDNGKAAVEKARELNPDVLLIDALMPGMSGYEVCEAVRATPELATKPILLLTGSFEPFDETKAKTCGADDFLAKPFESQQIITKVKELFDLGASRAAVSIPAVTPDFAATTEEPAAIPPADANDIWDAFTTPEETAPQLKTTPDIPEPFADNDLFATSGEESAPPAVTEEAVEAQQSDNTGSHWIPVDEETFEFGQESVAKESSLALDASPEPSAPDFGELEVAEIEEPAPAVAQPLPEEDTPSGTSTQPVALSEDQLRAALAGASKEVIERIVWEVVPDLAEIMIKEAIRKIREGA